MFQFPRLPLPSLCVQLEVMGNDSHRVYPSGDPRVKGYVLLTVAYRSLSRPSSASCAKASTVCPYHLLFDGSNIHCSRRCASSKAIKMRSSYKKIFCHAMQLSRYNESEPSKPDTGCLRIMKISAGIDGSSHQKVVSLERVISLERR